MWSVGKAWKAVGARVFARGGGGKANNAVPPECPAHRFRYEFPLVVTGTDPLVQNGAQQPGAVVHVHEPVRHGPAEQNQRKY